MKFALAGGIILGIVVLTGNSHAHDSWINESAQRNSAGEWCCGKMDCGVLSKNSVTPVPGGYVIHGSMYVAEAKKSYPVHEFVPNAEAQPSPDGAYWRCAVYLEATEYDKAVEPGGKRRCFFFPPPNT